MSQYSALNIKTKKLLKEKIGNHADRYMQNDSMFPPFGINDGSHTIVGPHAYDRKWYGQIVIKEGKLVSVK